MIELFPTGSRIESGVLHLDGLAATELAERFGTPLVVYSEGALRERARMFRRAVPDALVVYGTKAFPNVAVMKLLAEEGLGADVASLGELAFARRAGIDGDRLIVHGNNKSDEELRAAAEAGALVAIDALDEPARAAEAGVRRVLVRVTPGVDAETHEAIRTGHRGSKFGLDADEALVAIAAARAAGLEVEGAARARRLPARRTAARTSRPSRSSASSPRAAATSSTGRRRSSTSAAASGSATSKKSRNRRWRSSSARSPTRSRTSGPQGDSRAPRLVFEPGRSLVGPAAFTLYRVGAVKQAGDTRYVAIDGGMSDNPRPQLYDARYSALLANRAAEEPADGHFTIAGKHCESGDELIEQAVLPEPRRGDLIAVPATGGYTLSMGSNYNGVPRPAAVLVSGGEARLILRRETVDDLLAREP